jgi:hypothetical protein
VGPLRTGSGIRESSVAGMFENEADELYQSGRPVTGITHQAVRFVRCDRFTHYTLDVLTQVMEIVTIILCHP